ncbi:MAG: hypothetical protein LC104_09435 [Bacteroidales bacterium]|nr:hypothetical protein [Bacteroidales bacterium]
MPRRTEPASSQRHPSPIVVFFGFPHAGKTALLNACLRVNPRTSDEPVALSPISATTAEPVPLATVPPINVPPVNVPPVNAVQREVVSHVVPLPATGQNAESVVLLDCDGRSVADWLATPKRLSKNHPRGALTSAVHAADALVLAIDATASPEQVDHVFRSFREFLDSLEEGRTYGREVGGLPVFLTLTKCDRLCLPSDEPTDWLARIEDRKRELTERFRDHFLVELTADDAEWLDPSPFLSFGSLELHVVATAAHAPTGKMFAAFRDPEGSFGVSQFARECLSAAQAFHRRTHTARRRLQFTVYSLLGFVALLFLAVVGLTLNSSYGPTEALAARIREYRELEGLPSVHLADNAYPAHRKTLQAFHDSPLFAGLPDDLRQFVQQRLAEMQAYDELRTQFQPPRLSPSDLRSPDEISQFIADLNTTFRVPPEYERQWTETPAVKLRQKWLADLSVLQTSEQALYDWYRSLDRRATDLLFTQKPPTHSWFRETQVLFERAAQPPFDPQADIPGSPTVPEVARGAALTFAVAYEFDRILVARRDWEDSRDRLQNLRNLTSALGLTIGPDTPPAVLDLPEPGDPTASLTLATTRLQALEQAFPETNPSHPEWVAASFPDPVRNWLEPRLRATFDVGVRHVHRVIRAKIGENDSVTAWRTLPDGLLQEPALRDWGRLLGRLRHWAALRNADSDPVAELRAFLCQEAFPITLQAIDIALPDDLLDRSTAPAGNYVLTHQPADGSPARQFTFQPVGSARYERPLTTQRFEPVAAPGKWTLRPGDTLTAQLPLRSGGQDYRLIWSPKRPAVYTIGVVVGPPQLERVGPIAFPPERAAGVRVEPIPATGWPTVPVLLPPTR